MSKLSEKRLAVTWLTRQLCDAGHLVAITAILSYLESAHPDVRAGLLARINKETS